MKRMTVLTASLAVFAGMLLLAGCASTKNANGQAQPSRVKNNAEDKIVVLEDAGTSLGLATPQWVENYVDQGIPGVETMKEYQNSYCFVSDRQAVGSTDAVLQQLKTWGEHFDIQQQIGASIQTRVAAVFKAQESKIPQNEASATAYSNAENSLVTAEYSGAREMGSWWVKQRVEGKSSKDTTIRYRLWVLFTIPKQNLDNQLAAQMDKIKSDTNNTDLNKAFDAVSATLLQNGVQWDESTQAEAQKAAETLKPQVGPLK
jgi:anion-transporting  ArsA/GET3 family ATPase